MESQALISKGETASLQNSWKIYKAQWKTFIALTLFVLLVYGIYSIFDIIVGTTFFALSDGGYNEGAFLISNLIRFPFYAVFLVISSLLGIFFYAIPALYFDKNKVITWKEPYKVLLSKFGRMFLAGLLFTIAICLGYLFCIIPGILITFLTPVYVNKIICSDTPIFKAFTSSFDSLFKSSSWGGFIGLSFLAGIIYFISTICTCGIGALVTFPMFCIYIQHLAYNKGILN